MPACSCRRRCSRGRSSSSARRKAAVRPRRTAPRSSGRGSCGRKPLPGSNTIRAMPIWLTEQDVVGLLDLRDAIGALESALREEAGGAAVNMTKTLLQYGKSNLHAIGGKLGELVGTKTWAHTKGGTCPLLLLWDAGNGSLVAVIEAFALGNLRTGGISGLATDWMASREARSFA